MLYRVEFQVHSPLPSDSSYARLHLLVFVHISYNYCHTFVLVTIETLFRPKVSKLGDASLVGDANNLPQIKFIVFQWAFFMSWKVKFRCIIVSYLMRNLRCLWQIGRRGRKGSKFGNTSGKSLKTADVDKQSEFVGISRHVRVASAWVFSTQGIDR